MQHSVYILAVGGGVAGCVLARRLSENPKISVLLLEAGVDDSNLPYVAVPHLAMTVMSQKDIIWDYWSEPQPHLNMKRVKFDIISLIHYNSKN